MMNFKLFPTILFCWCLTPVFSQTIQVPFDNKGWNLDNAETKLEDYMGKSSIRLSNGAIFLPDVRFLNGTIEVDVNFPGERNFFGLLFRMQDERNFEHFYLRPHQSGKPDACQYTPHFNGFSGWQLYHGEGFGNTVDLVPDQWHHLKIVVKGRKAIVYFKDMSTPLLEIKNLKGDFPAGNIGLNSGQAVHFANFSYQLDHASYPKTAEVANSNPKVVSSWQLSQALDNSLFDKKITLDKELGKKITWTQYPTEPGGLLNIARQVVSSEGKTTVIARLIIPAEKKEIRGLMFGYSDQVMVYVNGVLQYQGSNVYRSRDYRYLGTIGYFDAVYLNLKAGDNEVWFVVTENFGGWGLQAMFL